MQIPFEAFIVCQLNDGICSLYGRQSTGQKFSRVEPIGCAGVEATVSTSYTDGAGLPCYSLARVAISRMTPSASETGFRPSICG